METSAFYQIAWLFDIKALAIRGISNVLNINGTDEKVHEADVQGSSNAAGKVLINLLDKLLTKKCELQNREGDLMNRQDLNPIVKELITRLNLVPHPEGGYYAQFFKSDDKVFSSDSTRYNNEERSAGTSIYYLLNNTDFSAWHMLDNGLLLK